MQSFEQNPLKKLLYTLVKHAKADIEARFTAAKVGVTPQQFAVLCAAKDSAVTIKELAGTFVMRPPSLVPAVNALERAGMLKRKVDSRDRRKTRITITKKGAALLGKVTLDDAGDGLNVAFRALSPEKQKSIIALLQDLSDNFSSNPHE